MAAASAGRHHYCMHQVVMLKASGIAGVRVNIMIWDEIDSGHNILTYTKVSKMLHGGGASTYFKDTKVSVKLMPRKSAAPQVTFAAYLGWLLLLRAIAPGMLYLLACCL